MPAKPAYPRAADPKAAFYSHMICNHMQQRINNARENGLDEAKAGSVDGYEGFSKLQKEVGLDDRAFQRGLQW